MSTSRRDFIRTKLNNFVEFCKDALEDVEQEKRTKLIRDLTDYTGNLELFCSVVVTQIKPYESDIAKLVERFLDTYGISVDSFDDVTVDKFIRYMKLFCKFVGS